MKISRGRCLLLEKIQAKGLTQAEYARRAKRSKRMISHFCKNERVMQPQDMYTAELLLDCNMRDLYEWIVEE